jgi:uncharacterized protein YbcV (DUF1398 family)
MTDWTMIARETLEASESNRMSFPESVRLLMENGFDGYAVDFRSAARTYFRPDGETLLLATAPTAPVGERFDVEAVRAAIREAQQGAAGYTYKGFCDTVARAGCAGYFVSLIGRRVLYFGRTAETHTEYFPGSQPST